MTGQPQEILTPNEWLAGMLDEMGMSNSSLARLIGRSRTEVQRWVNNREQIPRHHLAEIAAQLGTPKDLEYALKLKECEDLADSLRRRLRQLARKGRCDPTAIESAVFQLLNTKTAEEGAAGPSEHASIHLYNMTHASFVFRLWDEAASARKFDSILAPENMKMHIQYPANHFLGLALSLEVADSASMADFREQGLAHLRDLATARNLDSRDQLSSHHAIHMLARFGSSNDRAMITGLIEDATKSTELLSIRLGYAGLMLRPGNEELIERYSWMLQHNDALAFIDILFEAVHYGDATLGPDRQMPRYADRFEKSLASILRRLEQASSAAVRELETLRLISLLDRLDPLSIDDPLLVLRLKASLEKAPFEGRSVHRAEVARRLATLLDRFGLTNP